MSQSSEKENKGCEICGITAKFTCSGCSIANYCSKGHQKEDWNNHRRDCKRFRIDLDPIVGRNLVSTQVIKKGTKIFTSEPLIVGPSIYTQVYSCLQCNRRIQSPGKYSCSKCAFLFCSNKCREHHLHSRSRECFFAEEILRQTGRENRQLASMIILPLRALGLMNSDEKKFARLRALESHSEELQLSEQWPELEKRVIEPLSSQFDRKLVTEICGIVATNSFEIDSGSALWGLYDLASMMNHDCVGNTRIVIGPDMKILAFSSIDIDKNEQILFNYGRALDSTEERRKQLKEFKFFDCQCKRCSDPTELGTFVGALKCQTCSVGAVVPNKPGWKCLTCGRIPDKEEERRASGIIVTEKSKIFSRAAKSERDLRSSLSQLQRFLYSTHGFIIEVKLRIIQMLRPDLARSPLEAEKIWREKLSLCEDVLAVLDIVEPGLSLNRGLILHETQAAIVHLANADFERDTSQTSKLQSALNKARSYLRETKVCLDLETSQSKEAKERSETIQQEQQELENYIEMVQNI